MKNAPLFLSKMRKPAKAGLDLFPVVPGELRLNRRYPAKTANASWLAASKENGAAG
jgi:hypothetical protein